MRVLPAQAAQNSAWSSFPHEICGPRWTGGPCEKVWLQPLMERWSWKCAPEGYKSDCELQPQQKRSIERARDVIYPPTRRALHPCATFWAQTPTVSTAKATTAPGSKTPHRSPIPVKHCKSWGCHTAHLLGGRSGAGDSVKFSKLVRVQCALASNKWAQGTPTLSCQIKHKTLVGFELLIINKWLLSINISLNINII